jgi:hypothetical protein
MNKINQSPKRGLLLVLALVLPLTTTLAQVSTSTYNNTNWYRRGNNELQQKINNLGNIVEQNVTMPVLFGVSIRNISPNFGDPRSGGRSHEGEDIMAVLGTPIVSPTPAVVLRTGVGPSEGNYVYTAAPGGETFVYMHLNQIGEGVAAGIVLQKGDLVGYVGNTGNASGGAAHLHLEIHNSDGLPMDPYTRLKNEFTPSEKISFLNKIFSQNSNPQNLAQFLVSNFRSTFIESSSMSIALPTYITNVLGNISPQPTTQTLASNVSVTASSNQNLQNGSFTLSRNLYLGIVGTDVKQLQQYLNTHGFTVSTSGAGSLGYETNYFGPATLRAVKLYQQSKGIIQTGYVGPLTRASLAN